MTDVSRRDAVKLAAGLAVGAGTLAIREAPGQEGGNSAGPQPPADPMLELALQSPQSFMFGEQVTFKVESDGHSFDLIMTSVHDPRQKDARVYVPAGSMRIFRADAGRDAFTREGGFYWRFRDIKGQAQFKQPGALVMVVRDLDDTVRCYALVPDYRC